MSHTITINVAPAGTPLAGGGSSAAGHVWVTLDRDSPESRDAGFAPTAQGAPYGPGTVYENDSEHYIGSITQITYVISDLQYAWAVEFIDDPSAAGFDKYYHVTSSSCVSFVWALLGEIGMNGTGYGGEVLPVNNIPHFRNLAVQNWCPPAPVPYSDPLTGYVFYGLPSTSCVRTVTVTVTPPIEITQPPGGSNGAGNGGGGGESGGPGDSPGDGDNSGDDGEPGDDPGDSGGYGGGGDSGGGGGGGGCVAIESFLPDGRRAGDIRVEDEMDLADEKTLTAARGVVSYSQRKTQPGWRIVTQSGVSLRCSASAPIPTPNGLVLAPDLLGKQVAVRRDDGSSPGGAQTAWETVESVQAIGDIEVQHITVGDRCFWAGEVAGAFILHHNMKDSGGGGGGGGGGEDDPPWWWGDLHSGEPGGPSGVGRPVAANSDAVVATASPAAVAPVSASAPQAQALIQAMAGFSAPAADAGLVRSLRDRSVSEQLLSPLP